MILQQSEINNDPTGKPALKTIESTVGQCRSLLVFHFHFKTTLSLGLFKTYLNVVFGPVLVFHFVTLQYSQISNINFRSRNMAMIP